MRVVPYPDRAAEMAGLAETVARELAAALEDKGRASLAVPGGTTPGPFLTALSGVDLDWARIDVMLTDERFVPPTSERSNTRLLKETLFRDRAACAALVPLFADVETPEAAVAELSSDVSAALPLDVCVLGMGADMHTASLFPGADRLKEALDPETDAILMSMRADGAGEPRITLTVRVLRAAANLHVLIAGEEKKHALERAMAGTDWSEAPVRAVLSAPTSVTVHYAD
ncbi:6-phosphogluconolactonase [Rhodobium orientis]|uniref:6-phosphogluconolactonase n=1 Tax=Rhodobium orientis TaxID=34017 RepID=A0A327JII1_9HYPH|nr:6-phosphogluconolactonase [Rhodobium orientis]RAI25811.1 6-phosphogluconolactonase [Rhodobium orientis]